MLLLAAVLWQVGSLAKTDAILVRPIVVSVLVAFIINTALAWKYFLVVMSGVIALCLTISLVLASRTQATLPGTSPDKPAPSSY